MTTMITMMIKEMINGKPETERKSSLEWMKGRSTLPNTLYIQTPMMRMNIYDENYENE